MKKVFIIIALLFITNSLFAQFNILNAKDPSDIGRKNSEQKKMDFSLPLPYPYTEDRDVLWAKQVWERVDLDERFNLPLYYPTDTLAAMPNIRSLFDALYTGIKSGKITKVYADSYFTQKLSLDDIKDRMTAVDTTDAGRDQFNDEGYVDAQYINEFHVNSETIEEFHIRGIWYFDAKYSELKYRLLGIAPVAVDPKGMAAGVTPDLVEVFWVFFPDARITLHDYYAFNPRNTSRPIDYDHLLNARRFSGVIYKEDNVYGDRTIKEYIHDNALRQLLESQRIKEKIREYEEDMWNY
ncbi:MAG TPA: gliding motility protein GldN [Flavobacteriales bacterium]|jgi:gliding motility associated protien GldN|nr:gliding motility protein GldN [Flavobacteriales bacterium]